jgi:hypothetical protein
MEWACMVERQLVDYEWAGLLQLEVGGLKYCLPCYNHDCDVPNSLELKQSSRQSSRIIFSLPFSHSYSSQCDISIMP